jgi:hypothetical protein
MNPITSGGRGFTMSYTLETTTLVCAGGVTAGYALVPGAELAIAVVLAPGAELATTTVRVFGVLLTVDVNELMASADLPWAVNRPFKNPLIVSLAALRSARD